MNLAFEEYECIPFAAGMQRIIDAQGRVAGILVGARRAVPFVHSFIMSFQVVIDAITQ
jgi:hypothetical protein